MTKTWFTADTHFGHEKIIGACDRPFDSVEDMDGVLIRNWNDVVLPQDKVYHLGDFAFYRSPEEWDTILSQLNGQVHLIRGNHDPSRLVKKVKGFASINDMKFIKINDELLHLCHYPLVVWRNSHKGAWQLHGHSHGTFKDIYKQIDVGVDSQGFEPLSYEELEYKMEKIIRIPHIDFY